MDSERKAWPNHIEQQLLALLEKGTSAKEILDIEGIKSRTFAAIYSKCKRVVEEKFAQAVTQEERNRINDIRIPPLSSYPSLASYAPADTEAIRTNAEAVAFREKERRKKAKLFFDYLAASSEEWKAAHGGEIREFHRIDGHITDKSSPEAKLGDLLWTYKRWAASQFEHIPNPTDPMPGNILSEVVVANQGKYADKFKFRYGPKNMDALKSPEVLEQRDSRITHNARSATRLLTGTEIDQLVATTNGIAVKQLSIEHSVNNLVYILTTSIDSLRAEVAAISDRLGGSVDLEHPPTGEEEAPSSEPNGSSH